MMKKPAKKSNAKAAKKTALRDLTVKRTAGTVAGGGSVASPAGSTTAPEAAAM
jgi:hypothetical protein